MISVVMYGRNDSYSYNLHKRAAISINALAEVLDDPADEIIFVDCNTPDLTPTFPEAIADTLTERARSLLRAIRIRPAAYDRHKRGSTLPALDALSRNVAIRRSNPENRWILSTNSDVALVVRDATRSLSSVVAELADGFYETPRFELPEALWESFDRLDPRGTIAALRTLGSDLHLNEAIATAPYCLYDSPGDFQLILRSQFFEIGGMNEEMVRAWHTDSNVAARLYLLNSVTRSLVDNVFCYHCSHTRIPPLHHRPHSDGNDFSRFVLGLQTPLLPDQGDTWGMAGEELEEVRLDGGGRAQFADVMRHLLPGELQPYTREVVYGQPAFDHLQLYDVEHAFPHLANLIWCQPPSSVIAYVGRNTALVSLLSGFLHVAMPEVTLLVHESFVGGAFGLPEDLPARCNVVGAQMYGLADVFIVDAFAGGMPVASSDGVVFPEETDDLAELHRKLAAAIADGLVAERSRGGEEGIARRLFIFMGADATWMGDLVTCYFDAVKVPPTNHVKQGFVA